MALVLKDRVKQTTTTTGTGTLTLSGTVTGFNTFSVIGDGNTTYYAIVNTLAGEWEVGYGTYTAAGTTLTRTTVLESSNGNALVNFSAGAKDVFVTYPAEKAVSLDASDNVVVGGSITASTFSGALSGNATTASALATARSIGLTGDVSGSANFDGSANISITATVADDSHNHVISNVDGLQTALDAKAPLASPALTGTPTAPTAVAGTNTTQIATTSFVSTAVANLVDAAPATLDTLNELAAALGDDPNFATTVSTSLGTKAPLASPALTGTPTAPTAAVGTNTTQLATTAFVNSEIANDAPTKTGGGASGTWGINITGSSGSTTGNAATATTLQTARTINGVSFNGSANITVEPYVEDAGTTSATRYITFVDNSTAGYKRLNEDADLTYNPGTNTLTVPTVAAALSGNATTATTLQTARTIALSGAATGTATSFNGSANITIPVTALNASNLSSGTVPDARISGSYTGMTNLTGSGTVDFAKFLGNAADTAAAPSFSWTGDTNTGIYQPAADQIGIATGGTSRLTVSTTSISSTLPISASTFTGALSGNASTATTLQTARTINGTSFNGSANITTANWGTARTITIGNTGKSVNGSANVSWSISEIGAAQLYAGGAVYENTQTITSNYTMTTNKNGMSAGPITINAGVTVTIPSGSAWVVV